MEAAYLTQPETLFEMFERRLSVNGSEPFLVEPSGAVVSFEEVNRLVSVLAEQLEAAGSRPGTAVGLYLPNKPHWVVASLAAWALGCTVAAINRFIPEPAAAELLAISKVVAVCSETSDNPDPNLPSVAVTMEARDPESISYARPPYGRNLDSDAVIFFTSGTTGQPKGFSCTHDQLSQYGREQAATYSKIPTFRESMAPLRSAPVVNFTSFGHAAAYSSLAFALWSGRRLTLVPKFTVEALGELLTNYQFAALRLNPTALHMLATTPMDLDLSGIRYVYSGTAPLSEKTREMFSFRYGVPVLQGYGQSETGPISLSRYEDVVSGREPAGSVGRVLDRVEVRIADSDDRMLPYGVEGEIQVRSNQTVAPLNDSDLSVSHSGFVRTGDIGTLDADGFLSITGRIADKLVTGGFNVFPAEVEEALRRCEHVADAVVVGLSDDRLGERPVAGVVWRNNPRPDDAERVARMHLAAYKVPRDWFSLDEIPVTDRGKVDRRAAKDAAIRLLGS